MQPRNQQVRNSLVLLWIVLQIIIPLCRSFLCKRMHFDATASWRHQKSRTAHYVILNSSAINNELPFNLIAETISDTLIQSDLKRDSDFEGASTGWANWIHEASAFRFQQVLNKVCLSNDTGHDKHLSWMRWVQRLPVPLVLDFSDFLQAAVKRNIASSTLFEAIGTNEVDFLARIDCKMIILPSGSTLQSPLQSAPGAMIYGKLLQGGVTRFRMVGSTSAKRRAGERTSITSKRDAAVEAWLQYGGPERNYQAIDMGLCMVMEISLLRKDQHIQQAVACNACNVNMRISSASWNPEYLMAFADQVCEELKRETSQSDPVEASDHNNDADIESQLFASVGGLRPQIDEIVRRVLYGRSFKSVSSDVKDVENEAGNLHRKEMESLLELGLEPVRGMLLYGPPGCGKTLLARQLSTILDSRPAKIIAAPELLDRWVGGSEKLVRELFADAEAELSFCDGDPTKSALHVVIIDEIDAVFRRRSASTSIDSGEATRASTVNQILSKLDGITSLRNVLLIGLTNRRELLDPALLRPGRLEVHVEIPLPDKEGRREILQLQFKELRRRGRLSKPLCDALDGHARNEHSFRRRRSWLFRSRHAQEVECSNILDLAADRWTSGFSGADLAGLVRCAGSLSLDRCRRQGEGNLDDLIITLEDVHRALVEVTS